MKRLPVLCLLACELVACGQPLVDEDAAGLDAGSLDATTLDAAPAPDSAGQDLWTPIPDASTGRDSTVARDAASSDRSMAQDAAVAIDAGGGDGGTAGVELNPGWVGGACSGTGQCDDVNFDTALCETTGFPGGMCTQACSQSSSTGRWVCPDSVGGLNTTTRCIEAGSSQPRCVSECDFDLSPTGCRTGYACVLQQRYGDASSIFPVCLPAASQGWPGTSAPAFDIGSACGGDEDCGHLACMGGPGGYCTKTLCEFSGCPEGSRCFALGSSTVCNRDNAARCTACLKSCAVDGNCRESEGYVCDEDEVCWPEPTGACQPLAEPSGFNRYLVQSINDATLWPRDSSVPFCWLSSSCNSAQGMSRDAYYGGQRVFQGGGDCFCTGHALEVFLDAWRRYREANALASDAQLADLTLNRLQGGDFYQQWQGTGSAPIPNLASSGEALALVNAGRAIANSAANFDSVLPGDLINLSRDPPSGHAVLFVGWLRDNSNNIVGLRYYGCNPGGGETCADPNDPANSTGVNGPGFISEYFYGHGGTVIPSGIYGLQIGRVEP
ncbi:MAG: hypothetical protein ABIJ09_20280 [Pseudomonadota bacterium]